MSAPQRETPIRWIRQEEIEKDEEDEVKAKENDADEEEFEVDEVTGRSTDLRNATEEDDETGQISDLSNALETLTLAASPTAVYTRHDIYHIAFLLRQRTVADLVPTIMHYAEIFERQSCLRSKTKYVQGRISPFAYLTTPPLPKIVRKQYPVQKVTFTIRSRDQGWCSDPKRGNWTWFTAGVHRGASSGEDYSSNAEVRHGYDISKAEREPQHERRLVENVLGGKHTKQHVVVWSRESEDEEEREWVARLEPGDSIVVTAWAKFSDWENIVSDVSVAVRTTGVVA